MTSTSFKDPYLQSIVENVAKQQGFKDPTFSISVGSKAGDNYCGRVYRTVISETNNENKSLHIIVKATPLSEIRQKKINTAELFRTEADVYETVLPTLNKILNKYGVVKSDAFPGMARCYGSYLENDTCQVLVLADMGSEGFRMIGDEKYLDADHCRGILKYLSLWHAASLALKHHDPETAERIEKLITKDVVFKDPNNPIMDELQQSAVEGLTFLQEPFKTGNPAFDELKRIVDNYPIEMVKLNEVPSDLSCIIQGDCWFNNALYKYNKDGTFVDVCILDHQITRLGSPALDLAYMFFISTTKDVRDASYDELIQFYHDEVSSNLRKMKCDPEKIMSWDLLQEHLRKYGKMAAMVTLSGLHVILVDSSENSVDLHSADNGETVFLGRAKTSDPEKRDNISRRMTDIVSDVYRLGYLGALN